MDDITKRMNNWDGQNSADGDLFADAPPLKRCDGCGKYVEENLLKKCRVCGKYFCPVCRRTHDCRTVYKPTESEHCSAGYVHEEAPSVQTKYETKETPVIGMRTQTGTKKESSFKESGKNKELVVRLYGTIFIPSIFILILSFICFCIYNYAVQQISLKFIPIIFLVIGICILIIGLCYLIADIVRYCTVYYIISPNLICRRFGLINKEREDIRLDKIDGTHVKRGLFDLIFGSGTIIVYSVGGRKRGLGPIGKPYKIQKIISRYVEEYQKKY